MSQSLLPHRPSRSGDLGDLGDQQVATTDLRTARSDDGYVALEFVLWVPLLILVLLPFVAVCGRIVQADRYATAAAADAARAASLQRTDADAQRAATTTATQSLDRAGISCRQFTVSLTGSIQPGGAVRVTVTCTTPLSDLAIPGVPGSATLRATATAPIESTRGT